jgi:5-methylcytosine-specific restriction endonuclease McrA
LTPRGPRCPACTRAKQQQRDALRGSPRERGYDAEYQRLRGQLLSVTPAPLCHWGCGRLATTADHVLALSEGGHNVVDNLVPACSFCNSSRGAIRANAWRQR